MTDISMSREYLSVQRSVKRASQFGKILEYFPDRRTIIAEGDSWFGYPPPWFVFGKDANVLSNLEDFEHFNMLRLEKNGDEAIDMLGGKSKKKLIRLLDKHSGNVDYLLFSGGGNDIVGADDLTPLLNEYESGMSSMECINSGRMSAKMAGIRDAYLSLIDIRDENSPTTEIVTHTYDYIVPSNKGGEFVGGIIKTDPWMKPTMDRKGIPEDLQNNLAKDILNTFKSTILGIEAEKYTVVDTQGLLEPGNPKHWLNEIHPTSLGFGIVAQEIYDKALVERA